MTQPAHTAKLDALLTERILLLDGAMGTMIQGERLVEEDYRGARFRDWPQEVRGNNDLLVLTQPELIRRLHADYLRAGADIIETNTFNATAVSMADYGMQSLVGELNREAARLANAVAREWEAQDPARHGRVTRERRDSGVAHRSGLPPWPFRAWISWLLLLAQSWK